MINSSEYRPKKMRGYTLSETLIVMALIGVVMTMLLGTAIANANKDAISARLKKIYGVMSQAFLVEKAKSGTDTRDWDTPDSFGEQSSYMVFEQYIKPNLSIARDCKSSKEDICDFNFKELNGQSKSLNSNWTRFFLNDGMFLAIQYSVSPGYRVIYIYVDTNGKKRLNVVGRDIFMLEYWLQNDLHPNWEGNLFMFGHEYTKQELLSESNINNCNKTETGNYCGAVIMYDGWNIREGYPWAQARYVVK